jgi:hypothetical protein
MSCTDVTTGIQGTLFWRHLENETKSSSIELCYCDWTRTVQHPCPHVSPPVPALQHPLLQHLHCASREVTISRAVIQHTVNDAECIPRNTGDVCVMHTVDTYTTLV